MTFDFLIDDILSALADPFNPNLLIDRMSRDPELARLFAADSGVHEKYTIREHTVLALGMFERFQVKSIPVELKGFFRLFLALHDIGKPLAIELTGDKRNQATYTAPILAAVLEVCRFPKNQVQLALELEHHDILGQYLKDRITLDQSVHVLQEMSQRAAIPLRQLFLYLTVFFQSDAGAYTAIAGGKYALDYLFEVDSEGSLLSFADAVTQATDCDELSPFTKYQRLLHAINQAE